MARFRAVTNHSAVLPQLGSHWLNTMCENVNSLVYTRKQFILVNILNQFLMQTMVLANNVLKKEIWCMGGHIKALDYLVECAREYIYRIPIFRGTMHSFCDLRDGELMRLPDVFESENHTTADKIRNVSKVLKLVVFASLDRLVVMLSAVIA